MYIGVIIGILGLIIYIAINFKWNEFINNKSSKKRAFFGLKVIMVFVITFLLFVLVDGKMPKLDLSSSKFHTLSDRTKIIVNKVDSELSIKFFANRQDIDNNPSIQSTDLILQKYAKLNKKIVYKIIDPDFQKNIADSYGVENNTLVFEFNGKRKDVFSWELEKFSQVDNEMDELFIGEQIISSTIEYLISNEGKTIYFVKGHDEKYIDNYNPDGYSKFKEKLESQNRIVKSVNLVLENGIPEDCSLLIIANPLGNYSDKEIDMIDEYLDNNGKVILITDFNMETFNDVVNGVSVTKKVQKEDSNIVKNIFEKYKIKFLDGVVVNEKSNVYGSPILPYMELKPHPISNPLQAANLFPIARSIKPITIDSPVEKIDGNTYAYIMVVTTSINSLNDIEDDYANYDQNKISFEKDKGERRTIFPLILDVSKKKDGIENDANNKASMEDYEPKLMVVTDSDWLTNQFQEQFPDNNMGVIDKTINYMLEDYNLLDIPGKKVNRDRFVLTVIQKRILFVSVFFLIPILSLFLMFIVSRRRVFK